MTEIKGKYNTKGKHAGLPGRVHPQTGLPGRVHPQTGLPGRVHPQTGWAAHASQATANTWDPPPSSARIHTHIKITSMMKPSRPSNESTQTDLSPSEYSRKTPSVEGVFIPHRSKPIRSWSAWPGTLRSSEFTAHACFFVAPIPRVGATMT